MVGRKAILVVLFALMAIPLIAGSALAQGEQQEGITETQAMIAIGCGLAIGLSGISSSLGSGIAGISGAAVCAEKPERFGKSLVLQVLPQTQSIYGLVIGILLMIGLGFFGGGKAAVINDPMIGLAAIGIGLVVGLTSISAIPQGMAASAGITASARNPDIFSKSLIFTVIPETQAILGLVAGILIMVGIGVL